MIPLDSLRWAYSHVYIRGRYLIIVDSWDFLEILKVGSILRVVMEEMSRSNKSRDYNKSQKLGFT